MELTQEGSDVAVEEEIGEDWSERFVSEDRGYERKGARYPR